jgi:hypothetical protein
MAAVGRTDRTESRQSVDSTAQPNSADGLHRRACPHDDSKGLDRSYEWPKTQTDLMRLTDTHACMAVRARRSLPHVCARAGRAHRMATRGSTWTSTSRPSSSRKSAWTVGAFGCACFFIRADLALRLGCVRRTASHAPQCTAARCAV